MLAGLVVLTCLGACWLPQPRPPTPTPTARPPQVPLRMQVDAISFSAHADFPQTSEFLDALQPPHVVLVHGEAGEMARLKKALEQHAAALGIPRTLYMPKVTQPVLIEHRAEAAARVVGRLGAKAARGGDAVRGLLVQGRGGERSLLHTSDLPRFTGLHPGRVVQRQAVALQRPFSEVRRGGGWVCGQACWAGRVGWCGGEVRGCSLPASTAGVATPSLGQPVRLVHLLHPRSPRSRLSPPGLAPPLHHPCARCAWPWR